MTDHPDAAALDRMATGLHADDWPDVAILKNGAAAIRALQALRPHHPDTIVGRRYAHMFVGFDALIAAQKVVGLENALPRFDIDAARLGHTQDRADYYKGLDRSEIKDKWGGR